MLDEADLAQILESGRDPQIVTAQLLRLSAPPPRTRLHRPAVVGDGILQITPADVDGLRSEAEQAARAGRLSAFVPASGAATRLTEALLKAWQDLPRSWGEQAVVDAVVAGAPSMALWPALRAHGAEAGDAASILRAAMEGLELHQLPKGLVPFFKAADGGAIRPVDQHLADALALVADAEGRARVHFTVSPAHHESFRSAASSAPPGVEVSFSFQDPSTDTIAADASGAPFRDASGRPMFRPGGHGALLHNLHALDADVVVVRNIDNVAPGEHQPALVAWRQQLVGLLVRVQREAHGWVRALRSGADPAGAREFARRWLGPVPDDRLAERLDRPWRVAAMVPNVGQPGGGPFWAESPDGVTLQIVESAQVDPSQREILARATHFNPVDLVLGLRDAEGQRHDLLRWTDPDAILVSEKSSGGRVLKALEHPGLWNGGMARWNTVFVEAPAETFRPVKTLAELVGA